MSRTCSNAAASVHERWRAHRAARPQHAMRRLQHGNDLCTWQCWLTFETSRATLATGFTVTLRSVGHSRFAFVLWRRRCDAYAAAVIAVLPPPRPLYRSGAQRREASRGLRNAFRMRRRLRAMLCACADARQHLPAYWKTQGASLHSTVLVAWGVKQRRASCAAASAAPRRAQCDC